MRTSKQSQNAFWIVGAMIGLVMLSAGCTSPAKGNPTYSVKYNKNMAASDVPVVDTKAYAPGSTVTILANSFEPESGKVFSGWSTEQASISRMYRPGDEVTMPARDLTLYAVWVQEAAVRKVLYFANEPFGTSSTGAVPVDGNIYASGQRAAVLANTGSLAIAGYDFAGWSTSSVIEPERTQVALNSVVIGNDDLRLFAIWQKQKFALTYDKNGAEAGAVPVDSNAYSPGSKAIVAGNTGALTKQGFVFTGWASTAAASLAQYAAGDSITVTASITLYAAWVADASAWTITYDINKAATMPDTTVAAPVDTRRYATGQNAVLLDIEGKMAITGWSFLGWDTSKATADAHAADSAEPAYKPGSSFPMLADNASFFAVWVSSATLKVSYDSNGGGAAPVDTMAYLPGFTVTVKSGSTMQRPGYTFKGWASVASATAPDYLPQDMHTSGVTTPSTFAMGSASKTLFAVWAINNYTVSYDGNGSTAGTVPAAANYAFGSAVTIAGNTGNLALTGKTFAGWAIARDAAQSLYSAGDHIIIRDNVALYAVWASTIYQVSYDKNGATAGAIPVDSTSYVYGQLVTAKDNINALSKPGYKFTGWTGPHGLFLAPGDTFAITSDTLLSAQWTAGFTITYNANNASSGTAPVDANVYLSGETATIKGNTNLEKASFVFAGWATSATAGAQQYTGGEFYTVTASITLYAVWAPCLTLDYAAPDKTAGTVPVDAHQYTFGQVARVAGNPGHVAKTGFVFDGWKDGDAIYSPGDVLIFRTGNVHLVAAWKSTTASKIDLESSSEYLASGFAWSKQMALDYVQTGKNEGYIKCYWAGYPYGTNYRPAFYSRDFAHQSVGAHLLGLDAENFEMLEAFAKTATLASKYYPVWALGFDGTIYSLDWVSDTSFVREIPAVFELTQKGYELYQWTQDANYLNDTDLISYYAHSVNEFVTQHDEMNGSFHAGVADEKSINIFAGVASYNEASAESLGESGDSIGSQYQAYLAYAGILEAKGDSAGASTWRTKAATLKTSFNTNWYDTTANRYIRGFAFTTGNTSYSDWGKENSFFMPMKLITEPGTRTSSYLEYIEAKLNDAGTRMGNIEAYSYIPDTYYPYGLNNLGWKWLKYVLDSKDIYPEVAYTTISAIVADMMGVSPVGISSTAQVRTLPRLPTTGDLDWVTVRHIPVKGKDITVTHKGNTMTTLYNNEASGAISWDAIFDGSSATLLVNGVERAATQTTINGVSVSYVNVSVEPGQYVTVVLPIAPPGQAAYPVVLNASFEYAKTAWRVTAYGSGYASNNPYSGYWAIYIDPVAGVEPIECWQKVFIPTAGSYTVSAYAAADNGAATAGVLQVDGGVAAASTPFDNDDGNYHQYSVTFDATAGSYITIRLKGIAGAASGWVNIDDVSIVKN